MSSTPFQGLLKSLFFVFLVIAVHLLPAQEKYSVSGYVKDATSGEDLIGATVIVPEAGGGTYTNEYGYFSISLPGGNYTFIIRYLSYLSDTLKISLNKDIQMNFELQPEAVEVEEVVITDKKPDENLSNLEIGTATIQIEKIKKMPALFGEVDPIKNIQLLPGVQAVGEGISGFYVRGGGSDQNLILLDEATVFNASHVLGFFSVFNADAIKDEVKLYKGGIPPYYGGRLSSTLDIRMKEGNAKEFHGTGGIGLISSRLSLEGPIRKDKSSFMLSGRRTYGDLFLLLSKNEDLRKTRAYFYDFNAKVNFDLDAKNRIFISGYFGRDVFKFQDLFGNDWGNATGTIRWNHLFSDKLFSNTTLIFSDFFYGFEASFAGAGKFKFNSGIRDYSLKSDFTYFLNTKNRIRFGFQGIYHQFNPGQFEPVEEKTIYNPLELDPNYALENAIYISNEQDISSRLTAMYGIRFSSFHNIGPYTEFHYEADGETVVGQTKYSRGELYNSFWSPEPRLSLRYRVNDKSSIKAAYNRTTQYLHLASNSTASWPWDIWIPSSLKVKPQYADQVSAGYFRNFLNNKVETSVEVYYKVMQNQIDFKDGAELLLNPELENEILAGQGWAYGTEFFVKKNVGKLTGWVGYTLSWTWRNIAGINNGDPYPAKNDRRHDVSVVASYEVSPRVTISANWVYATGNAVTFPAGKYEFDGKVVAYYDGRNQNRMPSYHRMDLSVFLDSKQKEGKKFKSSWNFSLYNVYGRKNVFSIDFREDEDNPGNTEAWKIYLFRWVPSVTWNFEF